MNKEKDNKYEEDLLRIMSEIGSSLDKEEEQGVTVSFDEICSIGVHDEDVMPKYIGELSDFVKKYHDEANPKNSYSYSINPNYVQLSYFVKHIKEIAQEKGEDEDNLFSKNGWKIIICLHPVPSGADPIPSYVAIYFGI